MPVCATCMFTRFSVQTCGSNPLVGPLHVQPHPARVVRLCSRLSSLHEVPAIRCQPGRGPTLSCAFAANMRPSQLAPWTAVFTQPESGSQVVRIVPGKTGPIHYVLVVPLDSHRCECAVAQCHSSCRECHRPGWSECRFHRRVAESPVRWSTDGRDHSHGSHSGQNGWGILIMMPTA